MMENIREEARADPSGRGRPPASGSGDAVKARRLADPEGGSRCRLPAARSGWSRGGPTPTSSAGRTSSPRWNGRWRVGRWALTQPASVHGLGGVGKTLLAVEFAHRHADDYDAVLWLAAENPTVLASAFADLARELHLPEADEPDQNVRTAAVLRWLETHRAGCWSSTTPSVARTSRPTSRAGFRGTS